MTRVVYAEYLQSDAWRERRDAALERAGHRCQLCNSDAPLHVHHRTYDRLGAELPQDLTVLCEHCHQKFHDKLPVLLDPTTLRRRDGPVPEHDLIRVMQKDNAWRRRIAELLPSLGELREPEGAAIRFMCAEGVEAIRHLHGVTDPVRDLLSELRERPLADGFNVDALADGALARIRSRPFDEEIDRLNDNLALTLDQTEKHAIAGRIRELRDARAKHWDYGRRVIES